MYKIKNGDTISVHYTGTLTSGEVFDSSLDREPLKFTLGKDQLIPGFERAILGLSVGERVTTNIPSKEAYGEHNSEMVLQVPNNQLPPELDAQIGMQLQFAGGQTAYVNRFGIGNGKIKSTKILRT